MKNENNNVELVGEISEEPIYSHHSHGEQFYTSVVNVYRTSGAVDQIPVLFSERIAEFNNMHPGTIVSIVGRFTSFNLHRDGKCRLVLYVFCNSIEIEELPYIGDGINYIGLHGYICKEPVYRDTPNGRQITDVLIAVNRAYSRSDYIPCICWGRNAVFASQIPVGSEIELVGRIQSREYIKKFSETESEQRIAYEVSVSRINLIGEVEE